jgi:NADPH:quinone reductase-like Zn-dependent oxidoreductase
MTNDGNSLKDMTTAQLEAPPQPPVRRSRLKRIIKWTAATIFFVLTVWIFVAYWTSTNDFAARTASPAHPIKAILKAEYGVPDGLKFVDIEKPTPNDKQILIKVRAVSVNPLDGHMSRGGLIGRAMGGLRKPKETQVGVDYSGIVEAVGKNVTRFKPGDEVFGGRTGAFAEYICGSAEGGVTLKPANISFEQAASVPVAAITALQGLRDKGKIQAGQKVLINGASGGVGTFAVQIAKSFGAHVTGVCSTRNVDLVRAIGADRVIDYTKEDFTRTNERYDLIFDNVGNHSFAERRRILKPNGICVLVGIGGAGLNNGQMLPRIFGNFAAAARSRFSDEKFVMFLAELNKTDLAFLAGLMETGKVTPVIDRTYQLSEIPAAIAYLDQGHARGKVVVDVGTPN